MGRRRLCIIYLLTFPGMPSIFTFVLGQGVLKMEQSVWHIVEELLERTCLLPTRCGSSESGDVVLKRERT